MKENNLITKTFFWMFLGLLGTAIVAWYTYSTDLLVDIVTSEAWAVILVVEIVVVLLFSFLFRKLSPTFVGILFFVYSMINGLTLSVIFAVFEMSSIIYAFLATAGLFGGLAVYGYKTQKDISNWRTILYATLIIGLIISLINLFVGNEFVDIVLDWVILFVFFGLTVYDMNKVKQLQQDPEIDQSKVHIYCAMELYLDFINIFLRILSIFGKSRD